MIYRGCLSLVFPLFALTARVMGITVNSAVESVQTGSESKQRAGSQTAETFHTTATIGSY